MSKKPTTRKTPEDTVLTAPLRVPKSLRNRLNMHLVETKNGYNSSAEMLKAEGFRDKNGMWVLAMREFLDRREKK